MEFVNKAIQELGELLHGLIPDLSALPLVLLFAAVFMGVLVVPQLVKQQNPIKRRLAPAVAARPEDEGPKLRVSASNSAWDQMIAGLEKRAIPTKEKQRTTARLRQLQAGYVGPNAVRNYYAIRLAMSVIFPLTYLALLPFFSRDMTIENILLLGVCAAVFGLYLPAAWLSNRTRRRQIAVQESFPDALDMLMVCVEAGLGLDGAFTRVGAQMAAAHPVLAEHFGLVSLELRAGMSREAALRNLADRIGLPEVTSFVVLLIQSDRLGTSIGQTLRIQAEEMRLKRMLRAEEKAYKLPVKMAIPLVLCLLPAIVTVVALPGIIRIVRVMLPILSG